MKGEAGDGLQKLLREIVEQAQKLKDKHTEERAAKVNYACVFTQSQKEYDILTNSANKMGKVVKDTPTGPLFNITPLGTVAGKLRLVKIRLPDKTRPERGDADFTVHDYSAFKKACLAKPGFKLILRDTSEMIELIDPEFDVRAYFSNPPLDRQLGL
jgi:hypothetical protein